MRSDILLTFSKPAAVENSNRVEMLALNEIVWLFFHGPKLVTESRNACVGLVGSFLYKRRIENSERRLRTCSTTFLEKLMNSQ